jgi:hypothetical protein
MARTPTAVTATINDAARHRHAQLRHGRAWRGSMSRPPVGLLSHAALAEYRGATTAASKAASMREPGKCGPTPRRSLKIASHAAGGRPQGMGGARYRSGIGEHRHHPSRSGTIGTDWLLSAPPAAFTPVRHSSRTTATLLAGPGAFRMAGAVDAGAWRIRCSDGSASGCAAPLGGWRRLRHGRVSNCVTTGPGAASFPRCRVMRADSGSRSIRLDEFGE